MGIYSIFLHKKKNHITLSHLPPPPSRTASELPRIGSTWEGELGSDRWLRGSWRCVGVDGGSGRSGRWRARHIGRQAVHQMLGTRKGGGGLTMEKHRIEAWFKHGLMMV